MTRYRVTITWSITYYPPMTPWHESGGAGNESVEVNARTSAGAVRLALGIVERELHQAVFRLRDDASYTVRGVAALEGIGEVQDERWQEERGERRVTRR